MVADPPAITVSAVIPHFNRSDLLARVLRSLFAQRLPPPVALEVIVVDNGSRNGSAAVATELGARTVLLGSNQGVSRALNRGIEAAVGDWVALVNNDVDLAPDWLARLLDGALRAEAWFATGKIYDASRRDLLDGAGDAVCRGGAAWRLGHGKPDGPAFSVPRPTYFPAATASLFRREFFDRAGLFDEAFFAYLEDVDLGMRAAALGLGGVYLPQAVAWHLGSETGGRWSERSVAWITRHQLLLLSKHYSEDLLLRFARPVAVAQVLWAALALSRGRWRGWLRGLALGLADYRARWQAAPRRGESELASALLAGEAEIASFQQAAGWDTYWRWYFRLTRGGPR
jgi:GT2 family glycosyltransferase